MATEFKDISANGILRMLELEHSKPDYDRDILDLMILLSKRHSLFFVKISMPPVMVTDGALVSSLTRIGNHPSRPGLGTQNVTCSTVT